VIAELLRRPDIVVARCGDPGSQRALVRISIAVMFVAGAIFGGALGAFRGGAQIPAAALKIPLATFATLAICGPAFAAIAGAFGRRWGLRATLALILAAGARSSLILVALAPALWLAIDLGAPYHLVKLLATGAYGLAGLSALSLVLRGLGPWPGRKGAATGFVIVFLLVGAQSAWILRPYLGDPSDHDVPLLVNRKEGGVIGALWRSATGGRLLGASGMQRYGAD